MENLVTVKVPPSTDEKDVTVADEVSPPQDSATTSTSPASMNTEPTYVASGISNSGEEHGKTPIINTEEHKDSVMEQILQLMSGLSALEKTNLVYQLSGAKPKDVVTSSPSQFVSSKPTSKPEAIGGAASRGCPTLEASGVSKFVNTTTAVTVTSSHSNNTYALSTTTDRSSSSPSSIQFTGTSSQHKLDDSKVPRLPKFSGTSIKGEPSFRVWKFEVENLISTCGEREILRAIHRSVTGIAADTLMRLGLEATVSQVLDKFEHIFGTVVSSEKLLADFYTAQQKSSESVAEWSCRLEEILSQPQLVLSVDQRRNMMKSRFFHGLSSEPVRNAIRHRFSDSTYEQLLVSAREAEEELKSRSSKPVSKTQVVDPVLQQLEQLQKQLSTLQQDIKQWGNRVEQLEQRKPPSTPSTPIAAGTQSNKTSICNYCKQKGHIKKNCHKLNAKQSALRSER